MPGYKVSYKILRQQGDDMKAVAKLVDGYMERVSQIRGKLGDDNLLAEVRNNLGKLSEQLGESRTILNTAGEFLVQTVDNYTGVEIRQVKKVDATKAHNRDFYKNPVVVASAGGAVAGAAAAASTPMSTPTPTSTSTSTSTVNYSDNSVNVSYSVATPAAESPAVASPAVESPAAASPAVVNTGATPITSAPEAVAETVSAKAGISGAGIAAGAGVVGGAIGAGAVVGVKHLMDKDKNTPQADSKEHRSNNTDDDYNPEVELEKAIRRVKELESE